MLSKKSSKGQKGLKLAPAPPNRESSPSQVSKTAATAQAASHEEKETSERSDNSLSRAELPTDPDIFNRSDEEAEDIPAETSLYSSNFQPLLTFVKAAPGASCRKLLESFTTIYAHPPPDLLPGQLPRLPAGLPEEAAHPDVQGGVHQLLPDVSHGGAHVQPDAQHGGATVPHDAQHGGVRQLPRRSALELATDDPFPGSSCGPISSRAVAAERVRQDAQRNVMLRPLRLLLVGKFAAHS